MPQNNVLHPQNPFSEYARAIGWLCMRWTFVEVMIDQLLLTLLSSPNGDVGNSITSNIDVRNKIQIVKALGFLKKPDDQWFDELLAVLDRIDNDLRNKRNRYAHDFWMWDEQKIKKLRFNVSLKKPRAFKPLEITTLETTEVRPPEIWDAAEEISIAAGKIALLTQQHQMLTRRASQKK